MSKKLELSFDDWLEKYDNNKKEKNVYEESLEKLNKKIKENDLINNRRSKNN